MNIISKNWTSEDWETFYHYLKISLLESTLNIVFTKVDGTTRTMRCTLQPNMLPEKTSLTEDSPNTEVKNIEVLRVFDLDKNAWRSFHVKNVKTINFEKIDNK
jgi:hypothetical protein